MQTTLLGLGIAIILALVAAIVGPHYVDWSAYRSEIETRASAVAGTPVRVAGPIDVRLLPTPSLQAKQVEIGAPAEALKAGDVFVEFSLGSLIRGEYRATEVKVSGLELSANIDAQGRVTNNVPLASSAIDGVGIERLRIENSRLVFADARSGTRQTIEQLRFGGDVKSLVGPLKGEGGGRAGDQRFGYRISVGRGGPDGARVRLVMEPVGRPLSFDVEGVVRRDNDGYAFEGNTTIARVPLDGSEQWKLVARVKADTATALVEQLELEYGAIERAIKLTGTAEVKLGTSPQLSAVLSARQVDLDRLIAQPDQPAQAPFAALQAFGNAFARDLALPIPVRAGIAIDQVTLGGANIQTLRADVESTRDGWSIASLEMRAPGFAQIRASGALVTATDPSFAGLVSVESTEPRLLTAWLEGRRAPVGVRSGALRASGEVNLSAQRFAIDRLRAEVDRKPIEGRIALIDLPDGRSRLDADLKAAELDLDAMLALARATGLDTRVPKEIALSADIGRAAIAGTEVRGAKVKLKYDPQGLAIEALSVADIAGVVIEGSGTVFGSWATPRGALSFRINGTQLDGLANLATQNAPRYAATAETLAARLKGQTKLAIDIGIETPKATVVTLRADGIAGGAKIIANVTANGDTARWTEAAIDGAGRIESDDSRALARIVGFDEMVALRAGKSAVSWKLAGPLNGNLRSGLLASLPGLDASFSGETRFAADGVVNNGELSLRAADVVSLRPLVGVAAPLAFKAKMALTPQRVVADNLAGTLGNTPFSGRLSYLRDLATIDGRIDAESIDGSALLAALLGSPPAQTANTWSTQPLSRVLLAGVEGTIEVKAKRAVLTPSFEIRDFNGRLRVSDASVAIDDITGTFAGGVLKATLTAPANPFGTVAEARIALTNADVAALVPDLKPAPLGGRVSLLIEAKGAGRSVSTIVGSLSGSGTISLERPEVAALDARAFDDLERSAEVESADPAKVRTLIDTALRRAAFRAARADAGLILNGGQLRVANLLAKGDRAMLAVSGGIDLTRRELDARLTLYTDRGATPAGRPEINVLLRGPLANPQRTTDVSALIGWLALRSVDRQAKRLETLEAERAAAEAALIRLQAAQPVVQPAPQQLVPEARPPMPAPRSAGPQMPEQMPPAANAPRQRSLFDLFGASR
ncbi:putative assembly protein [Variibacter gotjawalensis]|uniref:Putative assembly protein n=1 Tax=Variibacter gotjawalensis TaxID=1333996 RepID=A0A0S3PTS1_9BRAD|nr:AsmA family protein [Variibacter gotjawalensis]NIK49654.1 large subunit ribosomal protein L24 [Variibacter gotjawalensis]RZS45666.1 large subunit ribosomal protein L24 [Variibacter gotjawalensis]BAT59337.1 putative assembly protein [Variibacter gotjawalensis]